MGKGLKEGLSGLFTNVQCAEDAKSSAQEKERDQRATEELEDCAPSCRQEDDAPEDPSEALVPSRDRPQACEARARRSSAEASNDLSEGKCWRPLCEPGLAFDNGGRDCISSSRAQAASVQQAEGQQELRSDGRQTEDSSRTSQARGGGEECDLRLTVLELTEIHGAEIHRKRERLLEKPERAQRKKVEAIHLTKEAEEWRHTILSNHLALSNNFGHGS